VNEKRAAVGYAPVDVAAPDTSPEAKAGYDPNQPRVPEGNVMSKTCLRHDDGGQWTDGGGGGGGGSSSSGGVRVAQANTGTLNDAGEQERFIQLAQAEEARSYRIDVREHEGRNGGHTIAEYVGRSDAYLLARARG